VQAADKLSVAISSAPNNLNPFYSTDANSQNINRLVHNSLVDFNEKMQTECKACQSFEEKFINGKQVIIFKLKENLTFTDSSGVTAEDVKKSWEYFAKNEKIKSNFMSTFEPIESIKVLNKLTLAITYSSFSLENLSNLGVLKIVKIKDPNFPPKEPAAVIGCGDYLLGKLEPLEINLIPRDKNKSAFVFKVVKDETTLALKLINKEIDLSVASISPRKLYWLKKKSSLLKVWEEPSANVIFMGLNHRVVDGADAARFLVTLKERLEGGAFESDLGL
jgi:peptide/nickel transport system substrate-binding protein